MDFRLDATDAVLMRDELFVIRAERRVVWCEVFTPPQVAPAQGAAAARTISEYLLENVIARRSSWLGVVLDARKGPTVVGPVTLGVLEKIFARAEQVRKPLAALIGTARAQGDQFRSIQQAHAPRFGMVTDRLEMAADWMTTAG
jgi:hypothetical protein